LQFWTFGTGLPSGFWPIYSSRPFKNPPKLPAARTLPAARSFPSRQKTLLSSPLSLPTSLSSPLSLLMSLLQRSSLQVLQPSSGVSAPASVSYSASQELKMSSSSEGSTCSPFSDYFPVSLPFPSVTSAAPGR
jgi:hypothetical protein